MNNYSYHIDTIDVSYRKKIEAGKMTIREAAIGLHKAGWFNYIPSEQQVRQTLKL